jgi:2-polyprenyl-3-methyl-5-hydroxy-6-metoxy-1,4-benzoquinol methylase
MSKQKLEIQDHGPQEDPKDYYNSRVEYMSEERTRHKFLYRGIDRCQVKPGVHALDLGCGTGLTTIYLARSGAKVIGVDYAEELIKYAEKHNSNDNTTYLVADITEIRLERPFDFIVLADVWEHIPVAKYNDLLQTIAAHSHNETVVYVNIPHNSFQAYGRDKFDQQPIDNMISPGAAVGMMANIGYTPVTMELHGVHAPAEYLELIFVTSWRLKQVWDFIYVPEASGKKPPDVTFLDEGDAEGIGDE